MMRDMPALSTMRVGAGMSVMTSVSPLTSKSCMTICVTRMIGMSSMAHVTSLISLAVTKRMGIRGV